MTSPWHRPGDPLQTAMAINTEREGDATRRLAAKELLNLALWPSISSGRQKRYTQACASNVLHAAPQLQIRSGTTTGDRQDLKIDARYVSLHQHSKESDKFLLTR